jgi:hypothetical protein
MRPSTGGLVSFGGYAYANGSLRGLVEAEVVVLCCFGRRLPEEKGRLEVRDSAGTRKAQMEWEAAVSQFRGRKACVRAFRKHVCAVLIEGRPAGIVRVDACA